MTQEQIEARRAYLRKWAHEHPESVKRSREKFWEKQARIMAAAESELQQPAGAANADDPRP